MHSALSARKQTSATGAAQEPIRTSTTVFPAPSELPAGMRERIASLVNIPVEHFEPTKLTCFEKSQYFRLHSDAMFINEKGRFAAEHAMAQSESKGLLLSALWRKTPASSEPLPSRDLCDPTTPGGWPSRCCTVFIYLNDVQQGGCTTFPWCNEPEVAFYLDLTKDRGDPAKLNAALLTRYAATRQKFFSKIMRRERPESTGLSIRPKAGMAVLHFPSLSAEHVGLPDLAAAHESEDAVSPKYIIQQFIWSSPLAPDDASVAAEVRKEWVDILRRSKA
jgi:hypothetical protein